ncbi:hypothetical protein KL86DES1_10590 [uncultured Desulfovibrio sp.]|uniref:Uncharacterized protein n=1 Tax=uncultured Desulfovibrio sp. TaxID=167968 RepID=A0A212L016_9BACT|nr:hypothetical protein KL86DES1_10590 [uncultured Desulfovibrio sp.]VZH32466.1 conserved protein of unknown function [Desulfovibrio sp. 86]
MVAKCGHFCFSFAFHMVAVCRGTGFGLVVDRLPGPFVFRIGLCSFYRQPHGAQGAAGGAHHHPGTCVRHCGRMDCTWRRARPAHHRGRRAYSWFGSNAEQALTARVQQHATRKSPAGIPAGLSLWQNRIVKTANGRQTDQINSKEARIKEPPGNAQLLRLARRDLILKQEWTLPSPTVSKKMKQVRQTE